MENFHFKVNVSMKNKHLCIPYLIKKTHYPGPLPTQSWSLPLHEEWLKSQGFPVSVQNAPRTFGDTSPTFD